MYMKWSNLFCLFPRRCAPLIAPSSRFATPDPSFQKEGTTGRQPAVETKAFVPFLPFPPL